MSTARKTRTDLRVVAQTGPDLTALDRFLTETASQMAPIISRAGSRRAQMETALKERDAEAEGLDARWLLVQRHYQAAEAQYLAEKADIDADRFMLRNALVDGAEGQGQ